VVLQEARRGYEMKIVELLVFSFDAGPSGVPSAVASKVTACILAKSLL
jgi:hypothetical protein